MKHVKCEICGSDDSKPFCSAKCPDGPARENFVINKCEICGFVLVNPRPDKDEMKPFYFDEYYGKPSWIMKRVSNSAVSFFSFLRKRRIHKYKKAGKILDIGCGDGTFLNYMRACDWKVFGVETSESGCGRCEKKKINVSKDITFQSEYFDIITLWQSLEHMENPFGVLKEIHKVLAEDGVLIISAPNINSMEYAIFDRFWFHLDLPRHLHHFSGATLKKLLQKSGFKVLETEHCSFEYNPYGLMQTIMNTFTPEFNFFYKFAKRNKTQGKKFILNMAVTLPALIVFAIPAFFVSYIFSFFKRGGVIHVYAKKNS
ncbi:MAG: class I SAM-dependent methyltransferase [Elusimicrobiales bacterium]|nr:class I SAM-dependent methyltransferase [Elusimicrobiales bacterium]